MSLLNRYKAQAKKSTWLLVSFLSFIIFASQAHSNSYKTYDPDNLSPKQLQQQKQFLRDYEKRIEFELKILKNPEMEQNIRHRLLLAKRQQHKLEIEKSHATLSSLYQEFPDITLVIWHFANSFYTKNSALPHEKSKKRLAVLNSGLKYADKCIKLAPKDPNCWLSWVALKGRSATLAGVFRSLLSVNQIHQGITNAYNYSKAKPFPNGVGSTNLSSATFALSEFYRVLPDSIFIKWITGHRGDLEKSYKYAQQLHKTNIFSVAAIAKSSICHGADREQFSKIKEGLQALKEGLNMSPSTINEENEYRRIFDTYQKTRNIKRRNFDTYYDIGCTDYGNDDQQALAQAKSK